MSKSFGLLVFVLFIQFETVVQAQGFPYGILKVEANFNQHPDQKGSAIVVGLRSNRLFLITAKHVVRIKNEYDLEDASEVRVVDRFGSSPFIVTEVRPIAEYDLAILIIEDRSRLTAWREMEFRMGQVGNLKTDTRVTAIGFPSGEWDENKENRIKDADKGISGDHMTFSNIGIKPGFSGGALLKGDGKRVIGMIIDDQGGTKAQAIRIDRIIPILHNQNIPVNFLKLDPIAISTGILEITSLAPLAYGLVKLQNGSSLKAAYDKVDGLDGESGLQTNAIIRLNEDIYLKEEAESKINDDHARGLYGLIGSAALIISGISNEIVLRKKQKKNRIRKRKK